MEPGTGVIARLGIAQTLAWGSTYYLPAMLATPMASDLGVTPPTVFAAFSVALIVSALIGPSAGRLIDRTGGRSVLVATSLIFALGLAGLGLAQGFDHRIGRLPPVLRLLLGPAVVRPRNLEGRTCRANNLLPVVNQHAFDGRGSKIKTEIHEGSF